MVRWRYCLVLALLAFLPKQSICRDDADDEGRGDERGEENHGKLSSPNKSEHSSSKRASGTMDLATQQGGSNRTTQQRPVDCFICAYKTESPLRACLDPIKFKVPAMTCRSMDEKCFTVVLPKGSALEAVVRGCRSNCVGSADTSCCALNRCNNQTFAVPVVRGQSANTTDRRAAHDGDNDELYVEWTPFPTTEAATVEMSEMDLFIKEWSEEKELKFSRFVGCFKIAWKEFLREKNKASPPPPGTLLFVTVLLVVNVLFVRYIV